MNTALIIFISPAVLGLFTLWLFIAKNSGLFKRKRVIKVFNRMEFEDFCFQYLHKKKRSRVKQTARVKDGGYDLTARRYGKKYVIECKYYPRSTIGVAIVRSLYGVAQAKNSEACLMYVGKLSKDAQKFCKGKILLISF